MNRRDALTREQLLGVTSQMEKLAQEAASMPATLSDARQIWANTMLAVTGLLDQALGASEALAGSLIWLADGFRSCVDVALRLGTIIQSVTGAAFELLAAHADTVGKVATIAGAALVGYFAGPALIGGILAVVKALRTGLIPALSAVAAGIRAITLAMMANTLGLVIAGISAAVAAAFVFRDQIKN